MKAKIIVMSHGSMAKETLESAKMILGDLADAFAIEMGEEDGLSGTQAKLDEVLLKIDKKQDVLVLADLRGGTPCNVAMMKMAERPGLYVVSGLNLGMLIESCVSATENTQELVNYLVNIGKESVSQIELPEVDGDDYEEE